jgi:hypothetical protein
LVALGLAGDLTALVLGAAFLDTDRSAFLAIGITICANFGGVAFIIAEIKALNLIGYI